MLFEVRADFVTVRRRIDFKETFCEDMDWIKTFNFMVQWRAFVSTKMNSSSVMSG
jgi:hypothetical protein